MLKYIFFGVMLIGVLVFVTNRGLHRNYLYTAETNEIFRSWENRPQIEMLLEFATLPDYDRALVERRCLPVYQRFNLLVGTTDILPYDYEPVCQTLINSSWRPGWQITDGLTFLREKAQS